MMPGVNSGITDGQRHGHNLSALGILETKSSILGQYVSLVLRSEQLGNGYKEKCTEVLNNSIVTTVTIGFMLRGTQGEVFARPAFPHSFCSCFG